MGIPHQLRLRTKKSSSQAPANPRTTDDSDTQLEVALLFTSPEATITAIERTLALLTGLNARINLIAVQTVPYPLALNNPPVSLAFNEQRLLDIAAESPINTSAHLYVCRSPFETLSSVLKPGSIMVVGTRNRWWPAWERKLSRKLESVGFRIVLLELTDMRAPWLESTWTGLRKLLSYSGELADHF